MNIYTTKIGMYNYTFMHLKIKYRKDIVVKMYTGNEVLDMAYEIVLTTILIILALMVFLSLIRAIKGPKIADRIVSVNIIGTLTMVIIGVLAVKINEGYLVDVCIIYAMISFLAVTLLTKVYMGVYAEKKKKEMRQEVRDDSTRVD